MLREYHSQNEARQKSDVASFVILGLDWKGGMLEASHSVKAYQI